MAAKNDWKASRCKNCDKIIRKHNKAGLCTACYRKQSAATFDEIKEIKTLILQMNEDLLLFIKEYRR